MNKITYLFLLIASLVFAQPGTLDASFNPDDLGFSNGYGADQVVRGIAVQPDGKILIGGTLNKYNGVSQIKIARLNTDGSLDTSFQTGNGFAGTVRGISVLPTGKLLVYGALSQFNGVPINRIVRLNADGSLDNTFTTSVGVDGNINDIAIQADEKIVIGGFFQNYNGTSRARIARLNADGTLDTSFAVGTGVNSVVNAVELQPDGKILIGGDFTTYNGSAVPRVARLNVNGSLDATFTPGTGANGTVNSIKVLSDNQIILAGSFSAYNGTSRNAIAKLSSNGVLNATFQTTNLSSLNTVLVQPDQKIIIGGSFVTVNGVPMNNLARLNSDGTLDTGFDIGTGPSDIINDLVLQPDGKVLVGGNLRSYNGIAVGYITRLESNGSMDLTFNKLTGSNGIVYCSATQPDGKILVGGDFITYNGVAVGRIMRINPDGSLDTTFDAGAGTNDVVYSISLQPDGKIVIGGFFNMVDNVSASKVARLNADGSLDTSFNTGVGANNIAYATALQPDGKILLGGHFTQFNGIATGRLVRLNPDGSVDTSFAIGTASNSYVQEIFIQPDGKILVVGGFTNFNGSAINRLVRLNADGTIDSSFNIGSGFGGDLSSASIQPDGKIVVVGDFTSFNGSSQNRIVRLNADGSKDDSFNVGSGFAMFVRNIDRQADGSFVVIGSLGSYNGTTITYLASLKSDGSLDTDFASGTKPNGDVITAVVQPDGKILIGGPFTGYNGTGRNKIARLFGNLPPTITITGNLSSPMCEGQPLTISFTTTGSFNSGNIFTAQLSDGAGSFASPIAIGTLESSSGGDISASIPAGIATGTAYRIRIVSSDQSIASNDNGNDLIINALTVYYLDADGDGFGNAAVSTTSCDGAPQGYTNNAFDCNDNALTYVDADGDGFGGAMFAPCGVSNNLDCDDNQLQYVDADGDGFGSGTYAACGVLNNFDCNDNLLQYVDADGDGFGSNVLAACGVINNSDCDDSQLQYVDADGDGFGSGTYAACGVLNNYDCNDNQLQYVDADGDGFGSNVLAPCGLTNNSDCDDNQLQYVDADGDGFGSGTYAACSGIVNNYDCNDNQLQYVDADGDGFGSNVLAPCGLTNNSDCDDNQLQYVDADGDGFGSGIYAACSGIVNNYDCNDNQLQYVDADGDGFGSNVLAPCGLTNNSDCDDNQLQYVDADGDGFGSGTYAACSGIVNNYDCNDNLLQYVDADGDGYGANVFAPCGVLTNTDCDDTNSSAFQGVAYYVDADGDGYGSGTLQSICSNSSSVPDGYSNNNSDCDDTRASVHPLAVEIGYNLIDDDCDGSIDEGFPPKSTVIMNNQCNVVLPSVDTQLMANLVAGAQGYQWRITSMSGPNTGQVQTLNTPLRAMKLSQLANFAYNTIYKVEVAVIYNGFVQPYTASDCTVTTPIVTTKLAKCGQTLTSVANAVYADIVPFATGYRFRITDAATPSNTQEIYRNVREFRMNLITAFSVQYNKTYNVEVSVKNTDGSYLPYGAMCTVTTPAFPTTSIQDSQCNNYLPAGFSTPIYAMAYTGAIAYVFNLSGNGLPAEGAEITRTTRAFKLSDFPMVVPGSAYNVKVRLVFSNGDLPGEYGPTCTVVAPGLLRNAAIPFAVSASPNPFAAGFNLQVTSSSTDEVSIKIFDMTGRLLERKNADVSDVNGLILGEKFPSGVYNVILTQGDEVRTLRVVKR